VSARYVRSTGGNWSVAGTWESVSGLKDAVAVPTSDDDVYCDAQSGQLTIDAVSVCRSFDCAGYTSTITHNNFTLTIGTTASRSDGVACIFGGTYTVASPTGPTIIFSSTDTAVGILTVNFANNTVPNVTFQDTKYYKMQDHWSMQTGATLTVSSGVLDTNSKNMSGLGCFAVTGVGVKRILLGSSTITVGDGGTAFNYGGSNLILDYNTATVVLAGANPTFTSAAAKDWSGMSLKFTGAPGTATFTTTGMQIFKNWFIEPTTTKTIVTGAGGTTITGNIYTAKTEGMILLGKENCVITKTSGVVDLYNCDIVFNAIFTGGAIWNANNNCVYEGGSNGVNFLGGNHYVDHVNGNDSTTMNDLGWWRVLYTSGSGTKPVEGVKCQGRISSAYAYITVATEFSGDWSMGTATGYLYFYGKTGTLQAEICDFNVGGASCSIASDASYCASKTFSIAKSVGVFDSIRAAKSPAPTSIGQLAQWTTTTTLGGGMPATKAVSGTSNAGGLVRVTTATQDWTTNDVIQILGVGGTVEANGNWLVNVIDTTHVDLQGSTYVNAWTSGGTAQKINSKAIVLTTAVTQDICDCDSSWTAGVQTTSANVDTTVWKEGRGSVKIITAATCNANQIIAQYGLPVALDLNAGNYQQLSFWIRNETTALVAGDLQIRLYGDTACTVLRDVFSVQAISSTAGWAPFTVDLAANIGSGSPAGGGTAGTIQGIAVYTTVQFNAKTVYVDNFIACKASSLPNGLTLQSMVSKNTLEISTVSDANYGNEGWICLQSITGQGSVNNGRILLIDQEPNAYGNAGRGYSGVTESTTIYKRETIKTLMATLVDDLVQSNSLYTYISLIKGGYDVTTNVVSGVTFYDGLNGFGKGMSFGGYGQCNVSHFSLVRYGTGYYMDSLNSNLIFTADVNHNRGVAINMNGLGPTIGTVINANNNSTAISTAVSPNLNQVYPFVVVNANSSTTSSVYNLMYLKNATMKNLNNNGFYGLYLIYFTENSIKSISNVNYNLVAGIASSAIDLYNTNFIGNTVAITSCTGYLKNCYVDGTEFAGAVDYKNSRIYSTNHDNTLNNHYVYTDNGVIASDGSFKRTGSTISWKLSPTNLKRDVNYPLDYSIAKVACEANKIVVIKAWMTRSSATDIGGKLYCEGGQIAGVGTVLVPVTSSLTCFATSTGIPSTVRANPTVFTQVGHGLYDGDEVVFSGIIQAGWTALNGSTYVITKLTSSIFSIAVDSTGYAADYDGTDPGIYSPWQNLMISFVPTESGVVKIQAHAWWVAGTADENIWVDSITITET